MVSRRKESRKSLAVEALCRTARDRQQVSVSDISCRGCRIRGDRYGFSEGQKLVLNLPDFEGMPATVRWSADQEVGIEFDTPLHASVVDHLCRLYPDADNVLVASIAA